MGEKKYPDSAILLNYNDDDFSQGYGQIKKTFEVLTKNYIYTPHKSDQDLRSSNNDNDVGYNLYFFDIGYQKKLETAQPIEKAFKFYENVPAGIYAYALLITNKLVCISSDGQRPFGLT